MSPKILLELCNAALASEFGLTITCPNPKALQINLCNFTRGNPDFATLTMAVPAKPNTVFIIKKSTEINDLSGIQEPLP
jgi:hypothetical protein